MIVEWIDTAAAVSLAAFINGLWLGAILTGGAWALIGLLSKRLDINATTRYIVWATVFVMCVGLMVWRGLEETRTDAYVEAAPASVEMPLESGEASGMGVGDKIDSEQAFLATDTKPLAELSASTVLAAATAEKYVIQGPALGAFGRRVAFGLWGAIAGMLLLRIGYGLALVYRLKRRSRLAPAFVESMLADVLARVRRPRGVDVGLSEDVETAVALGFFRPMILLPADMLTTLDPGELEQVIVHEAAHIQRRDDWTMLFQRLLGALFFFHPGMIVAARHMDREREIACDDWVLAMTKRPKGYATCLAKLVSSRAAVASPVLAPGFSTGKKQFFERVEAILNRNRNASRSVSGRVYAGLVGISIIGMAMLLRVAPVVAFTNPDDDLARVAPALDPADDDASPAPPAESASAVLRITPGPNMAVVETDRFARTSPPAVPDVASDGSIEPPSSPKPGVRNVLQSVSALGPVAPAGSGELDLTVLPEAALRQPQPDDDRLSKASMIRLLKSTARISTSGDKTQLLLKAAEKLMRDPEVYVAYIDAAATIPSSGDRARALMALLKLHGLDARSSLRFLAVTAEIAPSGEKARVLLFALDSRSLPLSDDRVSAGFIDALETISSSGEYKRVATRLLSWEENQ